MQSWPNDLSAPVRSPLCVGGGGSPAVLLEVPAQLGAALTHTPVWLWSSLTPPNQPASASAVRCTCQWSLPGPLSVRRNENYCNNSAWRRDRAKNTPSTSYDPLRPENGRWKIISSTLITMNHIGYVCLNLCTSTFPCTAWQGKHSVLKDASYANVNFLCDWVPRSAASDETLRNVLKNI